MVASGVAPTVDIQTLYLAAAIVTAFFGVAFLAFHIIDASTRGILQWALGYFLIAGGLLLAVFRGLLPLFVYGPVTSTALVLAVVLLDSGVRDEQSGRPDVLDVGLPVVSFALLLVFSYAVPNLGVRLEILLVAVALGTGRTSWRLIRQGRAAEAGLRTALITFAGFYTLLAATMRAIALLALFIGPIQDFVGRHPIHAVLLPALMLFFIGAAMSKLWVHYMRAYAEARLAATMDPLTGVRNRRYVMPELERLFQRSQREGRSLACMMLDADAFKSINDSHGHRKGDEVLQVLAKRISDAVREYDLVGRYGGEEFIIVVPELERRDVASMAQRIHSSVRSSRMAGLRLTVSVGVAFVLPDDARADDLIQRADRALYRAKRHGRDRVEVDPAPPSDEDDSTGTA